MYIRWLGLRWDNSEIGALENAPNMSCMWLRMPAGDSKIMQQDGWRTPR